MGTQALHFSLLELFELFSRWYMNSRVSGFKMLTADLDVKIKYAEVEVLILKFWEKHNIFDAIQEERKKDYEAGLAEIYSFYDGPPFATGLPHYGHILAGTIKDVMTRYATQYNRYVERRFGWDCHGLPVEYEIDKKLGIQRAEDVAKMGIAKYNNECRQIVMRYAQEWESVVKRTGRWIDFRNDYKTMYPWYMESVWWVFQQLFSKGLIYKGTKIMPYSVGCRTPLSNFEAGQNFREVTDDWVIVALNIEAMGSEFSGNKLLIWTTTAWTLPANRAVCVNSKLVYARVRCKKSGIVYVVTKRRIAAIFMDDEYIIEDEFSGSHLNNLCYKPPFEHYKLYGDTEFPVLLDEFVTDTMGTGIVHLAPYFGEDDYRVCSANRLIESDAFSAIPIDENGKFTNELADLESIYFKDADKILIEFLSKTGKLFKSGKIQHSYPFCWRSDTPLIYMAIPSWFVRVESMTEDLKRNLNQSKWVPDVIKAKRFSNWLSSARDWAVSRNRYWGTPIPIWSSETGNEIICIGSIAELQQRTGVSNITDLHRESIDHLVIPSAVPGRPPLRRIPEVFDCWFESGAMPYAQAHYPFEKISTFHNCFPADFIAEGIDQTRGWFYTLLVLSTALFDQPPFRNAIINGLVLAADGKKMSKRKQNYPDPMEIVNAYGADALRFYLVNSALVRAGDLSFQEEGVRNIVKTVLMPWYNAFRFLIQNIKRYEDEEDRKFCYDERLVLASKHEDIFDIWLISCNETLLQDIVEEMKAYRLYKVTPRLVDFIEQLTNWYIRFKRAHLKGEHGVDVCVRTLNITFYIMLSMCKNMAAFMPFFAEFVYQNLTNYIPDKPEINSIHNIKLGSPKQNLMHLSVERTFVKFQKVIVLGRRIRERQAKSLRYPLKNLVVMHLQEEYLEDLKQMDLELRRELNCRSLTLTTSFHEYGVYLKVEPNFKLLGIRYKEQLKDMQQLIKNLKHADIVEALSKNSAEIDVLGHRLKIFEEIFVKYGFKKTIKSVEQNSVLYDFANDEQFLVGINFETTTEMIEEGIARDVVSRVQKLKKAAGLTTNDQVFVLYDFPHGDDEELEKIIAAHMAYINKVIKSDFKKLQQAVVLSNMIVETTVNIQNTQLQLYICHL